MSNALAVGVLMALCKPVDDRKCPAGQHGLFCHRPCDEGRYGPDCKYECSPHCRLSRQCEPREGRCTSGCTRTHCTEECEPGFWSLRCSTRCFCSADCNSTNGDCIGGHTCRRGAYGPDCEQEGAIMTNTTPTTIDTELPDGEFMDNKNAFLGVPWLIWLCILVGLVLVVMFMMCLAISTPREKAKSEEGVHEEDGKKDIKHDVPEDIGSEAAFSDFDVETDVDTGIDFDAPKSHRTESNVVLDVEEVVSTVISSLATLPISEGPKYGASKFG